MAEPNLYDAGYDVGFEDSFKEAQARIEELEERLKSAMEYYNGTTNIPKVKRVRKCQK